MLTSQRRRWRWEMRSSRPPGLQPVGELGQRPLVVDHAELPDVTPHLRLVFVGLAYVRICCNERDVIRGDGCKDVWKAACTCAGSISADLLKG